MDDAQTAFAQPYPPYPFDLDMMKRSLDPVSGPDPKKARWSPSYPQSAASPSPRDPFANYGYGPQASISQSPFPTSPLYATPSLSAPQSTSSSQLSPSLPAAFAQQQQQSQQHQQHQHQHQQQQQQSSPNPNASYNFSPYNLLGVGMPSMNIINGFPYNASFNHRIPSLNLNIPAAQAAASAGAYSPAAISAATNPAGRTVYVGNLPPTASVDELLNLVHFGPLESVRVLPEKSCVFLSFLDAPTAAAFHADATIKKLVLHSQELKIGWGKPSPVPAQVALAITQSNASRNVYLGGLDESTTEELLRDDLSRFGLIDQVKIVRDKNIGFVHFLSIAVATKVVNTLPTEPSWAGKKVNYGKDRCAYVPRSQQAAAQQAQVAAAQSLVAAQQHQSVALAAAAGLATPQATMFGFSPYAAAAAAAAAAANGAGGMNAGFDMLGGGGGQGLNRTVYLGNIHPETTTEELCNGIRGGVLQSIRYMQDKHIAFVTFIDPAAAFTFFQVSSYQGLNLNNRRLKIGWGKNSGPIPPSLALSVHGGATRNVYVGNLEDFEVFNEERLKRDFGEFGEIELVNFLKEKNCAFVNFTSIANAIKAIEGIKMRGEYVGLRIAHGKDRCANPPRSGLQGMSAGGMGRRSASGNGVNAANAGTGIGLSRSAPVSATAEIGEGNGGVVDVLSPGMGMSPGEVAMLNAEMEMEAAVGMDLHPMGAVVMTEMAEVGA